MGKEVASSSSLERVIATSVSTFPKGKSNTCPAFVSKRFFNKHFFSFFFFFFFDFLFFIKCCYWFFWNSDFVTQKKSSESSTLVNFWRIQIIKVHDNLFLIAEKSLCLRQQFSKGKSATRPWSVSGVAETRSSHALPALLVPNHMLLYLHWDPVSCPPCVPSLLYL